MTEDEKKEDEHREMKEFFRVCAELNLQAGLADSADAAEEHSKLMYEKFFEALRKWG